MNGETNRRGSLRLAATLLLAGQLSYIVVTQFHTGGDANDHPVIFAAYAGSAIWTAVHLAQFVAMSVLLAGLLALCRTLDDQARTTCWASRFGAALTVAALALYAALQAVDGVANKQADVAWVSASGPEKAARFASAEAIRWIEWGLRSYHDVALGFALLLSSVAVARATWTPRPVAYLMALSALAYLAQGWVVGSDGFSTMESILIVLAWVFSVAWMSWMVVAARRTDESEALSSVR